MYRKQPQKIMLRLLLRPFFISRELEVRCPRCKKVVTHGRVFVFSHKGDEPTGFIPDIDQKHCSLCVIGPKLFDDMPSAEAFIRSLRVQGTDYPVPLSPLEDLAQLFQKIGTNISTVRHFISTELQHRRHIT